MQPKLIQSYTRFLHFASLACMKYTFILTTAFAVVRIKV